MKACRYATSVATRRCRGMELWSVNVHVAGTWSGRMGHEAVDMHCRHITCDKDGSINNWKAEDFCYQRIRST